LHLTITPCGLESIRTLFNVLQKDWDINRGLLTLSPVLKQFKSTKAQSVDFDIHEDTSWNNAKTPKTFLLIFYIQSLGVSIQEKAQIQLSSQTSGFL
jgi:hypothetical protein